MKAPLVLALLLTGIGLMSLSGCGACTEYDQAYVRGSNIRSMSTIKGVAVALERHRQAHGSYPAAKSIAELQKELASSPSSTGYVDRWGEPLLVEVSADNYTLTSKGDDREGGHEFGGAVGFAGHSITLRDGVFVQYDASVQTTARKYDAEIAAIRSQTRGGV